MMGPGLILALLGLYTAWFPVETHASTPLILSLVFAACLPSVWRRSDRKALLHGLRLLGPFLALVLLQGIRSPDRCLAMQELFLLIALCTLFWVASLQPPSEKVLLFFALGLSALAVWGLYQAGGGLERLRPAVEQLPEAARAAALARISRARAFASLLLPSHLAVLLATVLPILLTRVQKKATGLLALFGVLLSLAGIAATRSPTGALLATGAGCLVLLSQNLKNKTVPGRQLLSGVLFIILSLAIILISLRPDVLHLLPLRIRVDNWSSALWIFSQQPFSGAGLGSFAHLVRTLPFEVGNYPVHAHCLPLEMLTDLGIGGLFLWAFGMFLLIRLSRTLFPLDPGLAVAILVIPLHNLVDFSIFSTGLALPWIILLAWAMARLPGSERKRIPPPLRWRAGLFALVGATLILSLGHLSAVMMEDVSPNRDEDAVSLLRRATLLAPWRSTAPEKAARIALDRSDPLLSAEARRLLEDFHWQKPESAVRAQLRAHLEMGLGQPIEAAMLLRRAAGQHFRDNRRKQEYQSFVGQLERAARDSQ